MSAENVVNKPEGFVGDKRYEFVPLADVLGGEAREAPSNISAFIRRVRGPAGNSGATTHCYRVVRGVGQKVRRESVGRAPEGVDVDEDFLGFNFGPGEYSTTTEWNEGSGRKGIQVDNIFIAEDWRPMYEQYQAQKRQAIKKEIGEAAPGVVSAAPDPLEYLAKTATTLLPLVEMFRSLMPKQESASTIVAELQKAQIAMFKESMSDMLKMRREFMTQIQAQIAPSEDDEEIDLNDDELQTQGEASQGGFMESIMPTVPAWLRPYLPDIAKGILMLLSGGVKASLAKSAILSDEDIKLIMADPVKWDETVKTLSRIHGADKVQKALAALKADDAPNPPTVAPEAPKAGQKTVITGKPAGSEKSSKRTNRK